MADDTFDLEGQEAARQAQADKERREAQQIEADYTWVMSYPAGRRFVWQLLITSGFWRSSYTGKREDTDFREGERNVALRVWAQLMKMCPTLAHKMQEENTR